LLFGGEANFGSTNVDVFSIGANGALTPVPGSPFNNPGIGSNSNVVYLPAIRQATRSRCSMSPLMAVSR
jgi:hypothetical protein